MITFRFQVFPTIKMQLYRCSRDHVAHLVQCYRGAHKKRSDDSWELLITAAPGRTVAPSSHGLVAAGAVTRGYFVPTSRLFYDAFSNRPIKQLV